MSFFRKLFGDQAPLFFFDPKKPKGARWSSGGDVVVKRQIIVALTKAAHEVTRAS